MVSPWWTLKVACGLALIGLVAWTGWHTPARLVGATPGLLLGQMLAVSGALLSLAHYRLLRRRVDDLSAPDRLVSDGGLFGWVRHPMYLGDLVLYSGLCAMAAEPGAGVLLALAAVGLVKQARLEDRALAERFGPAFETWEHRTGLLLPRLRERAHADPGAAGSERELRTGAPEP